MDIAQGSALGSSSGSGAPASAGSCQRLLVTRLRVKDVRNIAELAIELAPRFNVIAGDNGQGKTSLLEAVYVLATTRSFRTDRMKEVRRERAEFARVDAELLEGDVARTQRLTLSDRGRAVLLDGQRPEKLAGYAIRTPVVIFHPGDLALTMGTAAVRRDLLDRVGLFTDPALLDDRSRYRQALRERQKVLDTRGEQAPELDTYELLAARHGARLTQSRAAAAATLAADAGPAFARLGGSGLAFRLDYRPGGTADEPAFRAELARRRGADRRRHLATFGVHRDDLELRIDGRPARKHASQGQHRLLTLTLKLAELSAVRAVRGAHPLLLLDDVSSELDPTRTGAVYDLLRESPSQVWVTTTRPELFQTPGIGPSDRRDFRLRAGALIRP